MNSKNSKPPKAAERILKRVLPKDDSYTSIGDFEEYYSNLAGERGIFSALLWYWRNIIFLFPRKIYFSLWWSLVMFRNYLKAAFRNLLKYKMYSLINVSGLAAGITCFVFLMLYVQFEFSYDNYHKDADRIYRVALEWQSKNDSNYWSTISPLAVEKLNNNISGVENAAPVRNMGTQLIRVENRTFYENFCLYAGPEIFNVLKIDFISGSPENALNRPGTIVINERMAKKYFVDINPVGKTVSINDNSFEITGVINNYPENTHLKYNFLMSLLSDKNWNSKSWGNISYQTYIKIAPEKNLKSFVVSINRMEDKDYQNKLLNRNQKHTYFLQPLKDIHLFSNIRRELEAPGNPVNLYILLVIAVLVLVIACFNFTSLAVAKASKRAKEVGIRKVVGARRLQLLYQFIGESFFIVTISIIAACILTIILLPAFNMLTGRGFLIKNLFSPGIFLPVFVFLFFPAGCAGSYPAFFLSKLKPADIIKGIINIGKGKFQLRKILVTGQFVISISMIISTVIIYQQVNFMKTRHPGFDKEQKLIINTRGRTSVNNDYETVKNEFLEHPFITGAAVSSNIPGRRGSITGVKLIGDNTGNDFRFYYYNVDQNFIPEYGFRMIAGKNFQTGTNTDVTSSAIINRSALKVFDWVLPEEAIGKRITGKGETEITGVVEDFHFKGFKDSIEPFFFRVYPDYRYITLSVKSENLDKTVSFVKAKWQNLYPGIPFDYFFLNEFFDRQYNSEVKMAGIIRTFTLLAIFIACLGLFGLISHITGQRAKEIGIRKVLGASVIKNVYLLNFDLIKWVISANILAWPVTYYLMTNWLQNFAVKINISIWIFLISGLSALVFALLTVSFLTIKAAYRNPVDTIRYE